MSQVASPTTNRTDLESSIAWFFKASNRLREQLTSLVESGEWMPADTHFAKTVIESVNAADAAAWNFKYGVINPE